MSVKTFLIIAITSILFAGCCEKTRSEAEDLKAKHQKCEAGDTCVMVDMYAVAGDNNCLGPFQCSASMNKKNIASFKSEAKELADDYERCNECVQAGCIGLEGLEPFCNEETGKCDSAQNGQK